MAATSPLTETQILRMVEGVIAQALPSDWSARLARQPGRRESGPARLMVTSPAAERVTFVIEARRSLTAPALRRTLDQLDSYINAQDSPVQPLVAAAYLSPSSQATLAERGVSYVDSTGNLHLTASKPGLFVSRTGATRDPWPDDQPLRSLKGRGAGRAVRALVDLRPPYGVRELASRAGLSAATLSRVIELLEREAVLTRDSRGGVADLDWLAAIRRWSQDYELRRANAVTPYLEPRGLSAITEKLRSAPWPYAATASLAAQSFAPVAPTQIAVIYVEDAFAAADQLKLRPTDTGANVLLVEPFDGVVFERTLERDGLVTAAPSQIAVDLLTGPGREPSEGEELLDWMKANEDAWRT